MASKLMSSTKQVFFQDQVEEGGVFFIPAPIDDETIAFSLFDVCWDFLFFLTVGQPICYDGHCTPALTQVILSHVSHGLP